MSNKTKIIYLVYFGYEKTVIDSQVLTPVRKLKQRGQDISIVFFEGIFKWLRYHLGGKAQSRYAQIEGINFFVLPRIPRNMFWSNTFILMVFSWCLTQRDHQTVVHVRGIQATSVALPLKYWFKKSKIVCDARGIESEEYEYICTSGYQRPMGLFQRNWKEHLIQAEQRALKRSDHILCVSKAMKTFFKKKIKPDSPVDYVPCCVDQRPFDLTESDINRRRVEMRIENRIIVIYAGGVNSWQIPKKSIEVFKFLHKINPACFFMGLTPDVDILNAYLKEYGIDQQDYWTGRVPFKEVPRYLKMGDIGLLLREENKVNEYACPTKFAEFLAAGLHVITTPYIADVKSIVETKKVGTIIANLNDLDPYVENFQTLTDSLESDLEIKNRSRLVSKKLFSWDSYLPVLEKVYAYV